MFEKVAGVLGFVLLMALYEKYKKKQHNDAQQDHYDIVSKFLLNDQEYNLENSRLPILWVFIDYRKNSRIWENFGSRTTCSLNKPYQNITLNSIVKHASEDFNVCFIDDNAFDKLLPEWNYNLSNMPDPARTNLRLKGIYMLLEKYGGLLMPSSYLALSPVKYLYNTFLHNKDGFIAVKKNNLFGDLDMKYVPNMNFICFQKNSDVLKELNEKIDIMIKLNLHFQNTYEYEKRIIQYLFNNVQQNKLNMVDTKYIGVEKTNNELVRLFDLFESTEDLFISNKNGIYIPDDELELSEKYSWVLYLTLSEIKNMNNIFASYI